jgi:hypothetical protein
MIDTSLTLILTAAAVFLSVLLVLARKQYRMVRQLQRRIDDLEDVPFEKVFRPTLLDQEAYGIIEQERRRIWKQFSAGGSFSVEDVFSRSRALTERIAAVYFSHSEEPVYQATVEGLVHLMCRISERLASSLTRFPLAILRDRTVQDLMRLHAGYRRVVENRVTRFISSKYVTFGRNLVWSAYNVTNPWYYGRRMLWTAGKEAGIRYLLALVITIVGEEAVLLYRRAHASKVSR